MDNYDKKEKSELIAEIKRLKVRLAKKMVLEEKEIIYNNQKLQLLFDNTPIPLWEIDFTHLRQQFKALPIIKPEEIYTYFQQNPQLIQQLTEQVQITNINKEAIKFQEASNKKDLLKSLHNIITHQDTTNFFIKALFALADGQQSYESELEAYTLKGNHKHVIATIRLEEDTESRSKAILAFHDITELKRKEREVHSTKQKINTIVQSSLNGIMMINSMGKIIFINNSFKEMSGYQDDIIGRDFIDFVDISSKEAIKTNFEQRIRGNNPPSIYKFNGISKEGKVLHLELSVSLIQNEEHGTILICNLVDLSEKVAAKAQIEAQKKQFISLIEHAADGILIGDKNGDIILYNKSASLITGYNSDELKGINIKNLISPNDNKNKPLGYKELQQGKQLLIERDFINKNGKLFPVEMNSNQLSNGNYISIIRDISTRKINEKRLHLSKERFQAIVENSFEGIGLINDKQEFTYCNENLCQLLGYSEEEIIGSNFNSYITPEYREIVEDRYRRRLNGEKLISRYKFTIKRKDGKIRNIEISPAVFKTTDDKTYTAVQLKDITEDFAKKKALRETKDYLENILNSTSDTIIISDLPTNHIIDVNQRLFEMYGYTKEEVIGKGIDYLSSCKSPYDNIGLKKKVKMAIEEGLQVFEWHAKHKDGSLFWVEIGLKSTNIGNNQRIIATIRDIEEAKQNAIKLQQSEERFKILSDLTFEGILIHKNAKAIDGNLAMEKISGYSYDEIINKDLIELFILDEYKKITYQNLQKNVVEPYIVKARKKNKEVIFVEIESRNTHINGEEIRVTAIRDVSTQQKVKQDLEERNKQLIASEYSFKSIFNNSAAAIYILNKQGKFIDVNEGALKMYKCERDYLIGKGPMDVSAEGRNNTKEVQEAVPNAFKGEKQQFEFWGKRKNGEIFPKMVYLSSGNYFDEEAVFAFGLDISERKKNEQIRQIQYKISQAITTTRSTNELIDQIKKELAAVIDTTNFYVALYDEKSNEFTFPYYFDETDNFVIAPAANTLGKYVLDTKKPLLANLAVKKKLRQEGLLLRQGSLSKVWLGVPLYINKKISGVLAVQSYDNENAYNEEDMHILEFISEQISLSIQRKKTEEELIAALRKAKESDRLKSAFLANMSHEIRTPMNGIIGFSELLQETDISRAEQKEYLSIINRSGERLLNIIDDLIDISKIEANQVNITMSTYPIKEQLEEQYNFFKLEAKQKALRLKLIMPSYADKCMIHTDNNKLQAIFTNLIKNAIKYTEQGSIEIGFNIIDNAYRFYVKDTGIGIEQDRQEAIFKRFVQADIEDRKAMEGAGLGLAISTAYINMLGGEIGVESVYGKGSEFYFTIPTIVSKELQTLIQQDSAIVKEEESSLTILIAEDDLISYQYLKSSLKKLHAKIIYAKNGLEAIKMLNQNPKIDIILMDIKMPLMGGIEATKEIRKTNPDVVIIAQTAYAILGDRKKALAAGCNDYISKPINREQLLELIGKYH